MSEHFLYETLDILRDAKVNLDLPEIIETGLYKYWQMALRELLRFGIFLVVMVVVVSISYWLFILV